MKVTLVYPPNHRNCGKRKSHLLGLLYIASAARCGGHNVRIIDAQTLEDDDLQIENDFYKEALRDTDVVGISIPFSHLAEIGHEVVHRLKELRSSIPIVLGGTYVTCQPAMAATSGADYLSLGEGEIPFSQLLDRLSRGTAPVDMPGLVDCRNRGALSTTPYHSSDLDAMPVIARDLVPYQEYVKRSQRNVLDTSTASIITSRGCPYDCEFCSIHSVFGYKWRPRSVESVLNEIDYLIRNYDVHNLEIEDDNFTLDSDRAATILEGLIQQNEHGMQLTWTAPNGLRIDTLNDQIVELFARSGCRYVFLALEHGDEYVLNDIIGKKLDLNQVGRVISLFAKHRIRCYVFVLYGYPGETQRAFQQALEYYHYLKQLYPGLEYAFLLPEPYPGTRLWHRAMNSGWIPPSAFDTPASMSAFYYSGGPWILTPDMPREEVIQRGHILRREFPSAQTYVEGVDSLPPMTDSFGGIQYEIDRKYNE